MDAEERGERKAEHSRKSYIDFSGQGSFLYSEIKKAGGQKKLSHMLVLP